MHLALHNLCHRLCDAIEHHIRGWLNPSSLTMAGGSAIDFTRSKTELITANALRRQQLIILHRQGKRPKLNNLERIKLLLLARATPNWRQSLIIVQQSSVD